MYLGRLQLLKSVIFNYNDRSPVLKGYLNYNHFKEAEVLLSVT